MAQIPPKAYEMKYEMQNKTINKWLACLEALFHGEYQAMMSIYRFSKSIKNQSLLYGQYVPARHSVNGDDVLGKPLSQQQIGRCENHFQFYASSNKENR